MFALPDGSMLTAAADQSSYVIAKESGDLQPPRVWPEAGIYCRRGRAVTIPADRYDVFEQMHYVCFHYEFEHDPTDPDEECSAGGCPSAAIRPRPDRRPSEGA